MLLPPICSKALHLDLIPAIKPGQIHGSRQNDRVDQNDAFVVNPFLVAWPLKRRPNHWQSLQNRNVKRRLRIRRFQRKRRNIEKV